MNAIDLRGFAATIDALGEMLERDIAEVRAGNVSALRDVARTKRALATILHEQSGKIGAALANSGACSDLNEAVAVREKIEALAELVARHQRAISGAMDATRERISVVVEARRQAAKGHETYSSNAMMRSGTISRNVLVTSSTNA